MLQTKTTHKAKKKNNNWLKVWRSWHFKMAPKLNRKEWTRGPEQNSREFNATVCKKDREDYKPEPLVCSVYCYWLYITEKEHKYLITLFVTELTAGGKFLKDSATTSGTRQRQVNQWTMTQHRNDLRGKNVCMHFINK